MQARKGRSVHFRSKLPTEFWLSVANSATLLWSHPLYRDQAKLQRGDQTAWLCDCCSHGCVSPVGEAGALVLLIQLSSPSPSLRWGWAVNERVTLLPGATHKLNQSATCSGSGWSMDYMASDSYEHEAVKSSLASLFSKMTFLTFKNIVIIIILLLLMMIIINYIFHSSLIILAKILVEF